MAQKTARQIAESDIKAALAKCDKCFIAFGTFVDNREMANIITAALREQRNINKPTPAIITSSWTKAIRFKYCGDYYYVTRDKSISKVYSFENGILNTDVALFQEEAAPEVCMQDFIKRMEEESNKLDNIDQ